MNKISPTITKKITQIPVTILLFKMKATGRIDEREKENDDNNNNSNNKNIVFYIALWVRHLKTDLKQKLNLLIYIFERSNWTTVRSIGKNIHTQIHTRKQDPCIHTNLSILAEGKREPVKLIRIYINQIKPTKYVGEL